MATDTDFIAYVHEQAGLGARLTHRRMFGEYALYVDEKVVAFACDNSLFIKPSDAVTHLAANLPTASPYPGAKDYPVADELLDDGDRLRELLLETAALMPEPKVKQAKDAKPAKPGKRR
ncbi:MAG TPA: TfoX/Sxy family protein [Thermomonas sp.]|uniref:TfoX/Sxy family protein n=1 Tax=Thermomonas sp. TaxID=1971895 RepID=UPI002C5EF3F5|nr:TfoX/Sxy family protein [Thermomonas sp.]HOC11052.1 TfoX/Sxy family protein [Thermomonas sp.]